MLNVKLHLLDAEKGCNLFSNPYYWYLSFYWVIRPIAIERCHGPLVVGSCYFVVAVDSDMYMGACAYMFRFFPF